MRVVVASVKTRASDRKLAPARPRDVAAAMATAVLLPLHGEADCHDHDDAAEHCQDDERPEHALSPTPRDSRGVDVGVEAVRVHPLVLHVQPGGDHRAGEQHDERGSDAEHGGTGPIVGARRGVVVPLAVALDALVQRGGERWLRVLRDSCGEGHDAAGQEGRDDVDGAEELARGRDVATKHGFSLVWVAVRPGRGMFRATV